MTVGEKATLQIPPEYGYGDSPVGIIPPGSHLTFEVQLLAARDDTWDTVKWQILAFVGFLLTLCLVVPRIQ